MRPYLLAAAVAAAFLAGCDSGEPTASSKAPTTASGGATGTSPRAAPAGDSIPVPPPPKASGSGEVRIGGTPACTVSAVGSGQVYCGAAKK